MMRRAIKKIKGKKEKKAIVWHEVGLWIIALIVLALIFVGVFLLREKALSLLEKLKELLRFR